MVDLRLEKIREKDPIIATYTASEVETTPLVVYEKYTEHAMTHMSLGDTSMYLERLSTWALKNKGCVVGAIVGANGYGKTSTEIFLWYEFKEI